MLPQMPLPDLKRRDYNGRMSRSFCDRFLVQSLGMLSLWLASPLLAEGYITFPSDIDWVTRRSTHFEILYRSGETEFAERALTAAERAHKLLSPIFPEKPELTYIVLADFKDGLNGYAIDFPYPHMVIFASPPEGGSTLSVLDDWLESVILHELVHVYHLYPAKGLWKTGRAIFGAWVLPNGLMPSHLHEGLAVFLETELGTSGRGQGADFHMYRRMAAHEGKWGSEFAPVDLFEGSPIHWPHGHSPYFFGYWSWKEVVARKKLDGIRNIVTEQSGNWPYYISRPFERELGLTYPQLLSSFFEKGEKEARDETARYEQQGLSQETFLTQSRYGKWDLTASPDGKLLAYRVSHPDTGTRIQIWNADDLTLYDDFQPDSGTEHGLCLGRQNSKPYLLYTDARSDAGYQTFLLKARRLDDKQSYNVLVRQGSDDKPLEHLHTFSCSPDLKSITAYTEHAGKGRIVKLAIPHTSTDDTLHYEIANEWPLPAGTWISSVLDGETIKALVRDKTGSHLYEASEQGFTKHATLSRTHFQSLLLDPQGKLLTIGAEDGKNDLWEITGKPTEQKLKKRASVLGGLTSAAYARSNQLFALSYRHGGYDLATFDSATSQGKTNLAPARPIPVVISRSPLQITQLATGETSTDTKSRLEAETLQSEILQEETPYSPWPTLSPRAWVPNLLIVPDGMQISAWVPGFDIAQKNTYSLFGGYDTRGSIFFNGNYSHRFQKQTLLQTEVYYSPSYLISSKAFLRTWGGSIGLSSVFDFIDPRFGLSLQYRKLEALRSVTAKDSVGIGLNASHAFGFKSRPRAIAPHRGTRVTVGFSRFLKELGSTDSYSTLTASADQYLSSPWLGSHIFYFAMRYGHTQGTSRFNSFFQGGGELIFSQGRGFFLNRGYVPGSFLGRNMLALNSEYRFPLWEIYRGPGLWPAFLQRIHGALVTDALTFDFGTTSTNTTDGPQDFLRVWYISTGIELKSDWKLFYYLPATMRLGLYRGFTRNTTFGITGEPLYVTFALEAGLF